MPLQQIDNYKTYVNETLTVEKGGYEPLPVGNYHATFEGLEELETQRGKAYRWCFKIANGQTASELSDAETPPTVKNKTGRFLCALAKANLEKGVQVNPSDYIGKKYLLIVESKDANDTKITTFSMFD